MDFGVGCEFLETTPAGAEVSSSSGESVEVEPFEIESRMGKSGLDHFDAQSLFRMVRRGELRPGMLDSTLSRGSKGSGDENSPKSTDLKKKILRFRRGFIGGPEVRSPYNGPRKIGYRSGKGTGRSKGQKTGFKGKMKKSKKLKKKVMRNNSAGSSCSKEANRPVSDKESFVLMSKIAKNSKMMKNRNSSISTFSRNSSLDGRRSSNLKDSRKLDKVNSTRKQSNMLKKSFGEHLRGGGSESRKKAKNEVSGSREGQLDVKNCLKTIRSFVKLSHRSAKKESNLSSFRGRKTSKTTSIYTPSSPGNLNQPAMAPKRFKINEYFQTDSGRFRQSSSPQIAQREFSQAQGSPLSGKRLSFIQQGSNFRKERKSVRRASSFLLKDQTFEG